MTQCCFLSWPHRPTPWFVKGNKQLPYKNAPCSDWPSGPKLSAQNHLYIDTLYHKTQWEKHFLVTRGQKFSSTWNLFSVENRSAHVYNISSNPSTTYKAGFPVWFTFMRPEIMFLGWRLAGIRLRYRNPSEFVILFPLTLKIRWSCMKHKAYNMRASWTCMCACIYLLIHKWNHSIIHMPVKLSLTYSGGPGQTELEW